MVCSSCTVEDSTAATATEELRTAQRWWSSLDCLSLLRTRTQSCDRWTVRCTSLQWRWSTKGQWKWVTLQHHWMEPYHTHQVSTFVFASWCVHHLCFSENLGCQKCHFRLNYWRISSTYNYELNTLDHKRQAHAKAHCCNEDLIRQDDVEACRVGVRRGSDSALGLTLRQELTEKHQQHEHCVHGCIHHNVHCLHSSNTSSCFVFWQHWLFDQHATPVVEGFNVKHTSRRTENNATIPEVENDGVDCEEQECWKFEEKVLNNVEVFERVHGKCKVHASNCE